MNLLLNYFEPSKGKVTINNQDVKYIKNLTDHISIMRQEAILFNDTLRNNLTMYQDVQNQNVQNQDMKDQDIIHMLERLNLDKFASVEGLDTMINEKGANLSGGEQKRISLARTLLQDKAIIILDEPLANVDQETVEKIENIILSIENKMIFVITHQFSEHKKIDFTKIVTL